MANKKRELMKNFRLPRWSERIPEKKPEIAPTMIFKLKLNCMVAASVPNSLTIEGNAGRNISKDAAAKGIVATSKITVVGFKD